MPRGQHAIRAVITTGVRESSYTCCRRSKPQG